MRLTLADAGDSIEDANFDEKNADAQLRRLYTFVDWAKQILNVSNTGLNNNSENTTINSKQQLIYQTNENEPMNYFDRIFEAEINRAILLTEDAYENMLYKKVLKSGFFQLQIARDNYRELCSGCEKMSFPLLKRFIEIQTLLLAPICPHICDYVYQLLHPNQSIMKAHWPTAGQVDQSLIDSCNYLLDTVHDFRKRLDRFISVQQGKKSKSQQQHEMIKNQPNHATILVARAYSSWQTFILNELKQIFLDKNSFPDNKILLMHFKDRPEIGTKYLEKTMPFVSYCQQLVKNANYNINALNQHLTFDEYETLVYNQEYIKRSLKLDQLDIKSIGDENTIETMMNTTNLEDVVPGVVDLDLSLLCISQFTLHVVTARGARPDFHLSMSAEQSKQMYEQLVNKLKQDYKEDRIYDGRFGAYMTVGIENDGPVTIMVDSKARKPTQPNGIGYGAAAAVAFNVE
ncbi:unnamed protein product [Rotaria sp. Silwood2]|nr:unnamed protein product [Rotaria sp. Silwood2]CAF4225485.1 unnamed protein product [Rotaria sp. Silwood2]